MKTVAFSVKELKGLIQESSNEFKAKLGPGVKSGNETNNGKAYKDAEKRAKDYDGGLADSIEVAKYDKTKEGDDNRTTLDYEVDNVDQKYKDRIEAQALGYTSVAEKENGIEKLGDYDGNKQIFKAITDDADQWKEKMVNARASGLAARTYDKEKTFKHGDLYEKKEGKKKAEPEGWRDPVRRGIWPKEENDEKEEKKETNENKNIKTAYFKKTVFLTEGHMMSRIPDEFKVEENVFRMKDKTGNEYLLEWKNGKAEVISHSNKQGMNESIERMKALYGYKASDYYKNTTTASRLAESNESFTDTLDKARKIIK